VLELIKKSLSVQEILGHIPSSAKTLVFTVNLSWINVKISMFIPFDPFNELLKTFPEFKGRFRSDAD